MGILAAVTGANYVMSNVTWAQQQAQFGYYQDATVLLIIAIIGIIFLFRETWPFICARIITHEPVVGIVDKRRNIIPTLGFKLINNMWYYKNKPLPFVKKYPGIYFFAGMPFDVIVMDITQINNPKYIKVTKELIRIGYPNIDMLENAILFSMMTKDDPRVGEIIKRGGYKDYEDAKSKINPANLTIMHRLVKPFFSSIPLSELIGYGSNIPADNILGEVDDRYESEKPSAKSAQKLNWAIMISVIIVAIMGAVVLLYKLFKT